MTSVLVLGGTGMLGSMVTDELSRRHGSRVSATFRNQNAVVQRDHIANVNWLPFDAKAPDLDGALAQFGRFDWIVNAIGITKPLIQDDNPEQLERAVRTNVLLPHAIARVAAENGARVLQIATDCVYSGLAGGYGENAAHDALDVYGKTKSLGECFGANVAHLRCSIIGPEAKDFKFLLEWFRLQQPGAQVNGFVNHQWNGVTTLHFAKICAGIIETGLSLPHMQHVVPTGTISKAAMLHEFAVAFNRADIQIRDIVAPKLIDRTLTTTNPELNRQLWQAAGYEVPPTVPEMIGELAGYAYRFNPTVAV